MASRMKLLARPKFVEQVTLADLKFDDVIEVFHGWVRVDSAEADGDKVRLTFDGYDPMAKPSDVPVHRGYSPDPEMLCSACHEELGRWAVTSRHTEQGEEQERLSCEQHINSVLSDVTNAAYERQATVFPIDKL
ncbi:hypothetical protein [Streptomyces sp. NBC_00470]|uniref:hypothetical protein n=1 Tax=Streptomyces sp. NBC_00470 TaxID=2975753 RepID=UPI0030DEADE7